MLRSPSLGRRAAAALGCGLLLALSQPAGAATAPGTVITNVAEARWISGGAPGSTAAQHQVTIPPYTAVTDLALTKVGPAKVSAGSEINWKLLVKNKGSAAASGAQLTDLVPPQVAQVSASCTVLAGGSCGAVAVGTPAANGTPVTVTIPSLAPGGEVEVTVRGTVTAGSGTLRNEASVGIPGAVDPTPADNRAQSSTQFGPGADPLGNLRGVVWLDLDHDRVRDAGEPVLAGFVVRLYAADGVTVVAEAKTDAAGAYALTGLPAGVGYQLEFRDRSGLVVYGLPVTADGGGAPFAANVSCGRTSAASASDGALRSQPAGTCYSLTEAGSSAAVTRTGRTLITLQAGDTLAEQSLPLDPSGVVYDAVTRKALAGVAVTLQGPPGFDPAQHLLGGRGNLRQITDATGVYQYLLLAGAPAGIYRLLVEPPAQYTAPSALLPPAPTLDPTGLGVNGVYLVQPQPGPPQVGAATTYHLAFDLAPGDPDVLNNHIPIDPSPGAGQFTLAKSVNRAVAAIGDTVQYRLNVANRGSIALEQIEIADRLPPGFGFVSGSLRIDEQPAPDPQRSADGRTLSIRLPSLAAKATAEIRYVATVGSGASPGPAVNVAVAGSGGLRTPPARATVVVQEDLFTRRIVLVGRVIEIERCTERDAEGNEREIDYGVLASGRGIANARIYLEDGSTIRTDDEGKWHADGVRAGTHVVQLDVDSLPPGYEPVVCRPNTRRAGRGFSQFVNAAGGALVRADFYVRKTGDGSRAAEAGQRLAIEPAAGGARLTLQVRATASVESATATLMLPPGVEPASASLDGKPLPLERHDNLVTARLGARRGEWKSQLEIDLRGRPAGDAVVRAVTRLRSGDATHAAPMVQAEIGAAASASAPATIEFRTAAPAAAAPADDRDALEGTNKLYAAGAEKFDAAWLATATPGFEIVFPPPGFNPGVKATKVMVKHSAQQRVELTMNGEPVHALNRDRTESNVTGTVELSRWGGVPLRDGTNRLVAIAYDRDGRELARAEREIRYALGAVEAKLLPQESVLIADGRTAPLLAVQILDADGQPARPGIDGTVRIGAPYVALAVARNRDLRPLLEDPDNQPRWRVGPDGIARIRLEPTTTSGEVVLTFNFPNRPPQEIRARLAPELRDWILVGFAEGTVGYRTLKGNLESLSGSDADDNLYQDGRIAFYAKGRVRGDWLLTLAYDSGKERTQRGGNFGDRLGQSFQPNAFYSIYGDATSVQYDAASLSKLYVKIEREQFYALFGDFDTGLTVTELGRYSRSFNGIRTEYLGETLSVSAFAARTAQAFVRDELRGDGTSGAYRLSRENVIANSDKVKLETRDRFRPEVVLASRPLARGIDYDIDYTSGTIWFFSARPSRDPALNPQFIVVDYEAEDAGRDQATTAGGRAALRLAGGRAEVGVTAVRQGSGVPGDLGGVDATIHLDGKTRIRAEAAQTRRDAEAVPGAALPERANAYLVEIRRQDRHFAATGYVRSQEPGFGLGQQSGVTQGLTRAGGDLSLRLSDAWRLNALGYKERIEAPLSSAERLLAEGRLNYAGNAYELYAGARWLHEENLKGEELDSTQLVAGANYRLLGGALNLRLDADVVVGGSDGSPDYPSRIRLGADYRATRTLGLFATQEFTRGSRAEAATTRVGVRATPWHGGEAFSSVNLGLGEAGAKTSASAGLMQNLRLSDALSVSLGADITETLRGPAAAPLNPRAPSAQGIYSLIPPTALRPLEDYTTFFAGLAYIDGPWGATLRAERRNGASVDRSNVAATLHRDLSLGEALAATALYAENSMRGTDSRRLDLRLSYARRPVASRWILLNRFDFVHEEVERAGTGLRSRRLVDNFNANWQPRWGTQLSLQLGLKYALDTAGDMEAGGFTGLAGAELRQDIGSRFDIGLRAATLQTWLNDTRRYSYGLSVGTWPADNVWLGIGYNLAGFRDADFAAAGHTAQGWYLFFRLKFDQASGDWLAQRRQMFDPAVQ